MLISEITTVNKDDILLENSALNVIKKLGQSNTLSLMAIASIFGSKYYNSLSALKKEYNQTLSNNNCSVKIQKQNVKPDSGSYTGQMSNYQDNKAELISFQYQTKLIKILDNFRDEFIEGITTLLLGLTVGKSVGKAGGKILSIITSIIPGIGSVLGPMLYGLTKIPGINAMSGTFVIQKFVNLLKDTEFVESLKNYILSKYITHNYFQKTAPCNRGKVENFNIDSLQEQSLINAEQDIKNAVIKFMKKDRDLRKVLVKTKS